MTHASLSEQAREAAAVQIQDWALQHGARRHQFLLGDFNAEPHERSHRFWVGEAELHGRRGDWTDAWTAGRAGEEGFTFPAWRPEKRIDFVLYRTSPAAARPAADGASTAACPMPAGERALRVTAAELAGTEPTADTKHLRVASMLEPGSAVLPSDHLGLLVRFEIA